MGLLQRPPWPGIRSTTYMVRPRSAGPMVTARCSNWTRLATSRPCTASRAGRTARHRSPAWWWTPRVTSGAPLRPAARLPLPAATERSSSFLPRRRRPGIGRAYSSPWLVGPGGYPGWYLVVVRPAPGKNRQTCPAGARPMHHEIANRSCAHRRNPLDAIGRRSTRAALDRPESRGTPGAGGQGLFETERHLGRTAAADAGQSPAFVQPRRVGCSPWPDGTRARGIEGSGERRVDLRFQRG